MESAKSIAYAAVDTILVQRNWLLGKRIAIECLDENGKADYGKKTMKKLSAELKEKYGKGFDFSSLYKYVKFHQEFPQILDSLSPKSQGTICKSGNIYKGCRNQSPYRRQPSIRLPDS